jgi:hypothetical protein
MNLSATIAHYQRGVSLFGMIATLLLIGIFLTVGLKLAPVYLDHRVLIGAARNLMESGRAHDLNQTQIRQEIGNTLRINNIRDFDTNAIAATRANNRTAIQITYEKRVHLFSNVDAVLSFDDRLE